MENLLYTITSNLKTIGIPEPFSEIGFLILSSLIIAKILDLIFSFFIKRVISKTKSNIDDKIFDYLHKPVYYSILFICLFLLLESSKHIPANIEYILFGIFKSIAIAIWSFALFDVFILLIKWYAKREKSSNLFSKNAIPLFDNLGKIVIFLGAIYFILLSWNVDVTGWVASAGILSVVIGFGAKDTVANLFAGVFIMADAPYKEGDYINLDTGERGCVKSIGIRSTRIMTRDDIEITIPNAVIANSKIINESGGPYEKERVRLNISVSYDSDIDHVRDILYNIATASEYSCDDPVPRIRFREFGDSGLNFQLLFWIEKPAMRGAAIDEISSTIHKEFKKENIEIPYPQRTVHINKTI